MPMPDRLAHTPPAEGPVPLGLPLASWSSPSRRRVPSPRTRSGRASRRQRARSGTDTTSAARDARVSRIDGPLSELTKHMADIPIRDMETWVHRSALDRLNEVTVNGEIRKIKRPMNSFMLYRSAYAERAKCLLGQTNHQVVSRAAGLSWKTFEPAHIRDKYEELARIERENHAAAHPEYKFKPSRGPLVNTRNGELTPPLSTSSGPIADAGSPTDWEDSEYALAPSLLHHRSHSFEGYATSSRSSTPFDSPDSFMSQSSYLSSPWNTSYPVHGLPTVQPNMLHGTGHIEFRCATPLPQEVQYGTSSGLAGLPGATHHELLQPQPTHPLPDRIADAGHMDPQLLSYPSDVNGLPVTSGPAYPPTSSPYPLWGQEPANNYYLTTSTPSGTSSPAPFNHPQVGNAYLPNMQREPSWDQKYHDPSGAELEPWLDN